MKERLIEQVRGYVPFNEQEAADKAFLLEMLAGGMDISLRENLSAHLSASAWIVSPDRKQVLMAFHNLYNSWAWLGGHADGDWDLLRVARKEAAEESGVTDLKLLSPDIFSVEALPVFGHEKRGNYVSSHIHLNVTYLFEADPAAPLRCKPDENSGVAWINAADIPEKCSEPWMCERIYSKLCQKAKQY